VIARATATRNRRGTAAAGRLGSTADANAAARRGAASPLFRTALGDRPSRWADPVARDASGTGASPDGRSDGLALAGHVVLLVDDEPMILEILAQHCLALGMSVREAGEGAAAFTLLEADPDIEVLVTDVRMPGLDGPSLAERALTLRPRLKVIFVTGYTTYPSLTWPVLRKPFDLDELEAALHHALG
jgi:CheY-like chemotaxis protein